jgi:sRNA-binding carbon storage regulator CsrA
MSKSLYCEKPLKVKVEKIGENSAKLVFTDGQSVAINSKFLPTNTKEGDTIFLNLLAPEELNLSRHEVAKALLDEILH